MKALEELEWIAMLRTAARNARTIAAEMSSAECRALMLAIADDYDRISGACALSVDGHPDDDSPRNDAGETTDAR